MARIYIFGGPDQISGAVAKQLAKYGTIIRLTNNDIVAFNANPTNNPVDTAIVFAKMWDPEGMVGWKITGPGHGFTLVNINDWQGAVASAPLSHLGFHAPLLLTEGPTQLPSAVDGLKGASTGLRAGSENPVRFGQFVATPRAVACTSVDRPSFAYRSRSTRLRADYG